MRLLYAGHGDGRARFAETEAHAKPGGYPRASLWKLLQVHRVSRHHRRDRGNCGRAPGICAMTDAPAKPEGLSVLDRPTYYIGKTVPRPNLEPLMQGRGAYVSDIELPRMVH